MESIENIIKDTKISIPMTGAEMLAIGKAKDKLKKDIGLTLSHKELILYLVHKELNN